MVKLSKHPHYDDPTAFGKRFSRIEAIDSGSALSLFTPERAFKMGPIRANVAAPTEGRPFYFASFHGRDRLPTWDEVVWLRYHLIPDAAVMAMILPNLNAYINKEDTAHRFVFTMEQLRWALDPEPVCAECGGLLAPTTVRPTSATFACANASHAPVEIDLCTWNEQHGNGYLARR